MKDVKNGWLAPFWGFLLIFAQGEAQSATEGTGRPLPVVEWDPSPLDRSNPDRITSFADMLADVTPAVVSVSTRKILQGERYQLPPAFQDDPFLKRFFGEPEEGEARPHSEGLGSGVIVSKDGYIITNDHVVKGMDSIMVRLDDGREFEAEMVGADSKTDVAVLKIEGEELPTLVLADSDQARVGDIVFAVGNPLRVGLTVTQGIVSATNRTSLSLIEEGGYENFLQTDAAINLGNSGGALVDAEGRVLGINTAILSQSGGSIGIGFAIPANLARSIMMSLVETGEVRRGFLGVIIDDLTADMAGQFASHHSRGALITQVIPQSPAEIAGLRPGDVITRIGDKAISGGSDLRLQISQFPPDTSVVLEVFREGETIDVPALLTLRTDTQPADSLDEPMELFKGVVLVEITEALREEYRIGQSILGLVVTEVSDHSPHKEDLLPGMVILGINRTRVQTMSEAAPLLVPGKNLLSVYYQGKTNFLVIGLE